MKVSLFSERFLFFLYFQAGPQPAPARNAWNTPPPITPPSRSSSIHSHADFPGYTDYGAGGDSHQVLSRRPPSSGKSRMAANLGGPRQGTFTVGYVSG